MIVAHREVAALETLAGTHTAGLAALWVRSGHVTRLAFGLPFECTEGKVLCYSALRTPRIAA